MGVELESYSFPPPHPFTAERYKLFKEKLEDSKVNFIKIAPEKADVETILLFHELEHVELVRKLSSIGEGYLDTGDTPAYKGIFEASRYVVGTTVKLCNLILKDELDHAFNPVGGLHHASKARSAGFCVFNDVCIAIEKLREEGISRFLYVDIDDHHGDGVFYSYEYNPDIYILDVHEDGRFQYPGTGFEHERGKGKAEGTKVNIPLAPGAGDEMIGKIVKEIEKIAELSNPEFIILQAGADSLINDMLGKLRFTSKYHLSISLKLHEIAHRYCKGRIVALGGGGYSKQNCASAWVEVCKALAGV